MPNENRAKGRAVKSDDWAWAGFVLTAVVGGVVGYIKAYEESAVEPTWRRAVWGVTRRAIMAAFAGWMIYQLTLAYSINSAWGHILAGLCGMFAAEFFEFAWKLVKERANTATGAPKP